MLFMSLFCFCMFMFLELLFVVKFSREVSLGTDNFLLELMFLSMLFLFIMFFIEFVIFGLVFFMIGETFKFGIVVRLSIVVDVVSILGMELLMLFALLLYFWFSMMFMLVLFIIFEWLCVLSWDICKRGMMYWWEFLKKKISV